MAIKQTHFSRSWIRNNTVVYPLSMGVLHPLISHGFLGDHGVHLTPAQFTMHTVALLLFAFLLTGAQNRSLRSAGVSCRPLDGLLPMAVLMPAAFWTGYYTLYIPFDILFMMLAIGTINAVRFRRFVKQPRKWAGQSLLAYFLGAVAGIVAGFAAFYAGVGDLPGLARDIVLWLFISAPAGFVAGLVSGRFLKAQLRDEPMAQRRARALSEVVTSASRPAGAA